MTATAPETAPHWSSRLIFLLAAIGSAVGLGNVWRFSWLAGENGGGAFVLLYLACAGLIALPIVIAEIMIGRAGQLSPINATRRVALANGKSPAWQITGWLGVIIAFVAMTFYGLVAGWCLDYTLRAAGGTFDGLSQDAAAAVFEGDLLGDPLRLTAWQAVFHFLAFGIVAGGLRGGIERAVSWLMPALFGILLIMVIYALSVGDVPAAMDFLFNPDFSKLDGETLLAAISQAFFSVAIGAGATMMYGAFLERNTNIAGSMAIVVFADAAIAILAGVAIFPLVFGYGLEPASGPGLIFVTLPIAIGQMPAGAIIGALLFFLLFIAALTSVIATIEPIVRFLEENRRIKRLTSTIGLGFLTWLLGLGSVFSFNILADFHPLGFIPLFESKTIFDTLEYLSLSVLVPLSGLAISLFAGWVITREHQRAELPIRASLFAYWRFVVRFAGPVIILSIMAYGLGLFG